MKGLRKEYKSTGKVALNGIDLEIKDGVFGILGTNGAGKSTLIKIITSLVKKDQGEVLVFGAKVEESMNQIGYLPEDGKAYEFLTGMNFIEIIGSLRGLKRGEIRERIKEMREVLELPNLEDLISSYSKGNKEKVLFLSSIIHSPKLLILDEPFTGLDPRVIYKVKRFIKEYAERGNCVILCTHILEMASQLCDSVAILIDGNIKGIYDFESTEGMEGKDGFKVLEDIYLQEVGDGI